jgi:hypothetical protein
MPFTFTREGNGGRLMKTEIYTIRFVSLCPGTSMHTAYLVVVLVFLVVPGNRYTGSVNEK